MQELGLVLTDEALDWQLRGWSWLASRSHQANDFRAGERVTSVEDISKMGWFLVERWFLGDGQGQEGDELM